MSALGERALSPREWIGDDPFPWPPALGLAEGEPVAACFAVTHFTVGRTRSEAHFLKLSLTDCYGTVEARMWDDVDEVIDFLRTGAYVGVRGSIETYHDQRQLRIESLALLRVELDDLVLFMPRSARPAEHMDAELANLIDSVDDDALRALLVWMLAPGTETGQAFRLAPAAKQNHHAYLGGLIEHTLSVARVCDLLADHYGASLDRDLLISAALLHDIGKIREIGARAGFPYTDEGKLLGHIIIGMQMVADAARQLPQLAESRLLLLQHLIASHQGRYEWHSPREPRTLEAIVLHYADDLDAKLNQASSLIGAVAGGWTAYDRSFGRDFLRHTHAQAGPPAPPGERRSVPAPQARQAAQPKPGPPPAARPAHQAAVEVGPLQEGLPQEGFEQEGFVNEGFADEGPLHEEPAHEERVHEERVHEEPVHEEPVHEERAHEEPEHQVGEASVEPGDASLTAAPDVQRTTPRAEPPTVDTLDLFE